MGLIRLLLAISVVSAHSGYIFGCNFVGGKIAVQSFYIISGFYMSLILNEKYVGKNNSYSLFISNRFIRLYPIYLTVLIASVLASFFIRYQTHGHAFPVFHNYLSTATAPGSLLFLIFTNLFVFGQDLVMFLGINSVDGHLFFTENFWKTTPQLHSFLFIPQAWTLGLELMFYLIAPLILRKGSKLILTLILVSILIRLYIHNIAGLRHDPWTYRFFPSEVMFFLLGYFSYRLYLKIRPVAVPVWASIIVLASIVTATLFFREIPVQKISWVPFTVKELGYFGLIVLAIPFLFHFSRKSRLDNEIGELSYPVYISHVLILVICHELHIRFLQPGLTIAAITLVVSFLLNKLIADRFESFRQKRVH